MALPHASLQRTSSAEPRDQSPRTHRPEVPSASRSLLSPGEAGRVRRESPRVSGEALWLGSWGRSSHVSVGKHSSQAFRWPRSLELLKEAPWAVLGKAWFCHSIGILDEWAGGGYLKRWSTGERASPGPTRWEGFKGLTRVLSLITCGPPQAFTCEKRKFRAMYPACILNFRQNFVIISSSLNGIKQNRVLANRQL